MATASDDPFPMEKGKWVRFASECAADLNPANILPDQAFGRPFYLGPVVAATAYWSERRPAIDASYRDGNDAGYERCLDFTIQRCEGEVIWALLDHDHAGHPKPGLYARFSNQNDEIRFVFDWGFE